MVLANAGGVAIGQLTETQGTVHPRIARARAHRTEVRVFEDARGLVVLGRGLAGRLELSLEVYSHERDRERPARSSARPSPRPAPPSRCSHSRRRRTPHRCARCSRPGSSRSAPRSCSTERGVGSARDARGLRLGGDRRAGRAGPGRTRRASGAARGSVGAARAGRAVGGRPGGARRAARLAAARLRRPLGAGRGGRAARPAGARRRPGRHGPRGIRAGQRALRRGGRAARPRQ